MAKWAAVRVAVDAFLANSYVEYASLGCSSTVGHRAGLWAYRLMTYASSSHTQELVREASGGD